MPQYVVPVVQIRVRICVHREAGRVCLQLADQLVVVGHLEHVGLRAARTSPVHLLTSSTSMLACASWWRTPVRETVSTSTIASLTSRWWWWSVRVATTFFVFEPLSDTLIFCCSTTVVVLGFVVPVPPEVLVNCRIGGGLCVLDS